MEFEGDEAKNRRNIEKHGVGFELARRIFEGPVFTWIDDREDYGEVREISIGIAGGIAALVVVHTDRHDLTRIISARPASRAERRIYGQKIRQAPDH